MELNALGLSLCRLPAFGVNDQLSTIWPTLKTNIKTASHSFYEQIAQVEANELDTLPEKIKFTIWKYFNRAKYRATPFSTFASYTLVPVRDRKSPIKIEAQMQNHHFVDWKHKDLLNHNQKINLTNAQWLYSNNSAYQKDNEVRYLQLKEATFELASVNTFPELLGLINYCNMKRNKASIYNFMEKEHQLDQKQSENLILQLLDLQLLHTDQTANITGEDCFTRLNLSINNNHENYIIAERKLLNGALEVSKSQEIAEALQFIAQQLPKPQNSSLQNFKNAFLKKFEHQQVTLAMVMDPELGIGYGNLAQHEQPDDLIEQLRRLQRNKSSSQTIQYTNMHQFLINSLVEQGDIALEGFTPAATQTSVTPNTLSVICHFYNGNPVIQNAGGCTANALLGRFTLGSEALATHCKEIAELEQNANPDALFFDVAYQAETHIDNVNRRRSCYPYELPILIWSCHEEPLDFNDIMVTVQTDEIILFSKKLDKRLIPRLASAYNYSRSDLAVYRFLCDLQHQSIQSNLTFDIQTYLPGLQHYPRVYYKKVILSPAKWLIPKSIYQAKNKDQNEVLAKLANWLNKENITFLVKTGHADQTLCFNPNIPTDLVAIIHYCKQQGDQSVYLIEALIDEEDYLTDERGKKYAAEFVINFYHSKQIYNAIKKPNELSITRNETAKTHYLPGSEWLYFEIYVNPDKSNELLYKEINLLLKAYKKAISMWFFIRYDENGKHLRLRLNVRDLKERSQIIDYVNQLLTVPKLKGIVSDIAIKTYYPEIARYGATRIDNVEQFFHLDSKYVLSLLPKVVTANHLYLQALLFLNKITTSCFPSFNDRLFFVKQIAESLATEFSINQDGFKNINQRYTALLRDKSLVANEHQLKQLESCAFNIFMLCTDIEKPKMLADLNHMHINRLFNDRQRLQEAICYQFLYKQLLTERAHLTAKAEHQLSV